MPRFTGEAKLVGLDGTGAGERLGLDVTTEVPGLRNAGDCEMGVIVALGDTAGLTNVVDMIGLGDITE